MTRENTVPSPRKNKGPSRARQVGGAIPSLAALTAAAAILSTAGTSAQGQTCTSTDTAVTAANPTDADALAGDCAVLLGVKDTLRGTAPLNWSNSLSMASWTGISLTQPDRSRVLSIALNKHNLSGSIPDFSALTSLVGLILEDNQLSGSLPDVSALTSLRTLQLSGNKLKGSLVAAHLPASLEEIVIVENELSGELPDLSALTSLTHLYVYTNRFSGDIPDLSALTSLEQFFAYRNDFSGSIVAARFPTSLQLLLLHGNELSGSIPDFSAHTSLTHLYIHGNDLSGALPTTLPATLVGLHLSGNPKLSGGIPNGWGNLTSLTDLSLCETGLTASATLPTALETLRSAGTLTVRSDAEGPEGTNLSFDVKHSTWPVRGAASLTVNYVTADGTATSVDYASGTGSTTVSAISAPETVATATIEVAANSDGFVEGDEIFTVTLSVPEDRSREVVPLRSTATGTIRDATPPPPDPGPDPVPDPPPPGEPPSGGTAGGASVTLDFGQSLDSSSVPDASDFTVTSTSSSTASGSSSPNEPASVATAQTMNHTVTAVQVERTSVLLMVSPRIPAGASVRVSYTEGAKPLRTEAGAEIDSFSLTVLGSPTCPSRVAPYWHGRGGFAVRPADGESATVRIECAGKRYTSREHPGEDGLIVRTVSQPMCMADDGRLLEGEMTFEGIDGDGWYWVNGDRNVAVAPLVCEESLNPELRPPVPGGVTARPSGDRRFVLSVLGTWQGTLMVHDETGFMGIVPHLVDLEGAGEHVAPYWKGGGGIVGRPLDGSRATVRLACGEADAETQMLDAGEDGLIVELLPGCFDEDGAAVSGRLEVDGLEDGAWYWLNIGTASAAAPVAGPGSGRGPDGSGASRRRGR